MLWFQYSVIQWLICPSEFNSLDCPWRGELEAQQVKILGWDTNNLLEPTMKQENEQQEQQY